MLRAYRLTITLHEPLFWATRELGRLYLSEPYIHNYALTYALGFAVSTYHDKVQVPHYKDDLEPLNDARVYITPAKPLYTEYMTSTFKLADKRYRVEMQQSSVNIPTFGRIRELAPETQLASYVLAQEEVSINEWIRLGKWMSKAKVVAQECEVTTGSGRYSVGHPLNPLDVPERPMIYDLINMPPVSLIDNAEFDGEFLQVDELRLPSGLAYRFPEN